jgi:FMN hydrolase / 5-amino-6-(5-phospho-D-ribitylamino)uracil phosphatase
MLLALAAGLGISSLLVRRRRRQVRLRRAAAARVRCVTFDLDDTIWQCEPVITRAAAVFMRFLAAELPRIFSLFPTIELWREHSRAVCASGRCSAPHDLSAVRRAAMREAARVAGLSEVDTERAVRIGFDAFMRARNDVGDFMVPGALRLLRRLRKAGYQVGAVSNGNADIVKIPSLARLFDFAVSPASAGAKKPDLAPFRLAFELSVCESRHEMIHVGDSLKSDVWPAWQFGVHASFWVTTGSVWSGTNKVEGKEYRFPAGIFECASLTEVEGMLVGMGILENMY